MYLSILIFSSISVYIDQQEQQQVIMICLLLYVAIRESQTNKNKIINILWKKRVLFGLF